MVRGRAGRLVAVVWAVVSGLVAAALAVWWCGSGSAVGPVSGVVWAVIGLGLVLTLAAAVLLWRRG